MIGAGPPLTVVWIGSNTARAAAQVQDHRRRAMVTPNARAADRSRATSAICWASSWAVESARSEPCQWIGRTVALSRAPGSTEVARIGSIVSQRGSTVALRSRIRRAFDLVEVAGQADQAVGGRQVHAADLQPVGLGARSPPARPARPAPEPRPAMSAAVDLAVGVDPAGGRPDDLEVRPPGPAQPLRWRARPGRQQPVERGEVADQAPRQPQRHAGPAQARDPGPSGPGRSPPTGARDRGRTTPRPRPGRAAPGPPGRATPEAAGSVGRDPASSSSKSKARPFGGAPPWPRPGPATGEATSIPPPPDQRSPPWGVAARSAFRSPAFRSSWARASPPGARRPTGARSQPSSRARSRRIGSAVRPATSRAGTRPRTGPCRCRRRGGSRPPAGRGPRAGGRRGPGGRGPGRRAGRGPPSLRA